MQLTTILPNRESTLSFHRERWEQVLSEALLKDYPGRIETNVYGQLVMTPPARFIHGRWQSRIAGLLDRLLDGFSVTETGLITSDGVKILDVAWLSRPMFEALSDPIVLENAPEICVEILSPSNTNNEIQNKFRLYFEAGAIECWTCDLQGNMTYYLSGNVETKHEQSNLCRNFPPTIHD